MIHPLHRTPSSGPLDQWIRDQIARAEGKADEWDGTGRCPKCQGRNCDPEGGCRYDD